MPRPPATPPPADDGLRRVRAYLARAGLAAAAVTELAGDASDRRYVRVRAADGSSLVLLVHGGPIDTATLPFLNVAGLLTRMDVPVPAVRGRAGDLGILALEDLGDVTLERFVASAPAARRRQAYAAAVDLIARMQRRGRQLASPAWLPFTRAFDEAQLMRELDFFVRHFLLGHRRAALSPAARAALGGELRALARDLAAEPRVFCHRDFHSRNLMLRGGRLYVIDFQDARLGPDTYDLVSLLRDCYVRLEPSFVAEMVARYHAQLGASGGPALRAGFDARFDRMAVQRHLKALGTFGWQAAAAGNDRYLAAVPRTLDYLADVFRRTPRFDRLRELLAACLPALG